MSRQIAMAVLAVAGLAGCAAGPQGPGLAAGQAPPGFQCPAAGTTIQTDGGQVVRYAGTSPTDPFVCLVADGRGGTFESLAGWVDLPTPSFANVRSNLGRLWPLAPGQATSYEHEVSAADGQLVAFNTSWRVTGAGVMDVSGLQRQVLTIESVNTTVMPGYQELWTFAYDAGARAMIAAQRVVQRGTPNSTGWTAINITVPGQGR
ncbi:hypothetical protein [Falsiroseomonas oryzae]|uniref:hypothetical protein n=1 Tax=Falsiroseomonas oryzae TaxID=2766473 RepID=UPI0022EB4766|nr:hypothetical protein [Roseomonas sp. MO-31]